MRGTAILIAALLSCLAVCQKRLISSAELERLAGKVPPITSFLEELAPSLKSVGLQARVQKSGLRLIVDSGQAEVTLTPEFRSREEADAGKYLVGRVYKLDRYLPRAELSSFRGAHPDYFVDAGLNGQLEFYHEISSDLASIQTGVDEFRQTMRQVESNLIGRRKWTLNEDVPPKYRGPADTDVIDTLLLGDLEYLGVHWGWRDPGGCIVSWTIDGINVAPISDRADFLTVRAVVPTSKLDLSKVEWAKVGRVEDGMAELTALLPLEKGVTFKEIREFTMDFVRHIREVRSK